MIKNNEENNNNIEESVENKENLNDSSDTKTEENLNNKEFGYTKIDGGNRRKLFVVRENMTPKRQAVTTISTTIISSLPALFKYYNSIKDPDLPKLDMGDLRDFIIYKFPDLYLLIEKMAKGSKMENMVTKSRIVFILAPIIPTLIALSRHKERTKNGEFDYMLLIHIITYTINNLIPFIVTNPTVNYAFKVFFGGFGGMLFYAGNLLRSSSNPFLHEIGKNIPMLEFMYNNIRNLVGKVSSKENNNDNNSNLYEKGNQNKDQVKGKDIINGISNIIGSFGRNNNMYGYPYDYPYYGRSSYGYGNNNYYNGGQYSYNNNSWSL